MCFQLEKCLVIRFILRKDTPDELVDLEANVDEKYSQRGRGRRSS